MRERGNRRAELKLRKAMIDRGRRFGGTWEVELLW